MVKMPRFADPANLVIADDPPPKITKVLELDALRYLQAVYRGQIEAEGPRMRAAMACLQFERPKLAVIASVNDPAAFATRLEEAIRRSGKANEVARLIGPRTIEHEPKPAPEPSDITGSMFGTERKGRRL